MACARCRNSGAKFRCSGCRAAVYCSKECQRRAWPAHRAACALTRASVAATAEPEEGRDPLLDLTGQVATLMNEPREAAEERPAGSPERLAEQKNAAIAAAGVAPEDWRDWGNAVGEGLPVAVMAKVAEKCIAQLDRLVTHGLYAKHMYNGEVVKNHLKYRSREGPSLFQFAMVCKDWRAAQLLLVGPSGGKLCSRFGSDLLMSGSPSLMQWALDEGCPAKWIPQDERLMTWAIFSRNLPMAKWLRSKGSNMFPLTVCKAINHFEDLEMARWARANGCVWDPTTKANAAKLGYTDDYGNCGHQFVG